MLAPEGRVFNRAAVPPVAFESVVLRYSKTIDAIRQGYPASFEIACVTLIALQDG